MDIKEEDPRFSEMQNIKRRFFALRNGVIADRLRRVGDVHRVIFGLTLPQLVEVAQASGQNPELADVLWANATTRESRLLAPMVMPAEEFNFDKAHVWIESLQNAEEADILCHRLLRHCHFAAELVVEYIESGQPMMRYLALRLAFNLIYKMNEEERRHVLELARKELSANEQLTKFLATQLTEEAEFLLGE